MFNVKFFRWWVHDSVFGHFSRSVTDLQKAINELHRIKKSIFFVFNQFSTTGLFFTPWKYKKVKVFWCRQEVLKETRGMKLINYKIVLSSEISSSSSWVVALHKLFFYFRCFSLQNPMHLSHIKMEQQRYNNALFNCLIRLQINP